MAGLCCTTCPCRLAKLETGVGTQQKGYWHPSPHTTNTHQLHCKILMLSTKGVEERSTTRVLGGRSEKTGMGSSLTGRRR